MLATRYFVEQLTGRTPVETLRIQAARTERIRLPTRFSGLAGLGVPEAVLAPLTALVADEPDGIRESLLVGVFLLCAFEGYPFRAREGLQKWLIRRRSSAEGRGVLCRAGRGQTRFRDVTRWCCASEPACQ